MTKILNNNKLKQNGQKKTIPNVLKRKPPSTPTLSTPQIKTTKNRSLSHIR